MITLHYFLEFNFIISNENLKLYNPLRIFSINQIKAIISKMQ
jgi:hypothetical protein